MRTVHLKAAFARDWGEETLPAMDLKKMILPPAALRRIVVLGFVASLGLPVLAVDAQAAPTVTPGFDPAATLTGAVRYRNFSSGGGKEIWVGVPPLAFMSPADGDVTWGSSKCVQVTYDGSGTLTTKVANVATPCVFTSPLTTVTKSGLNLGTLNYLEIAVTKNTPTTSVALNGVSLTPGGSLGNFSVTGGAATTLWKVTDIDLTSGFTLTGTVALTGLSGSGDSNYIEIAVGSTPPSDSQGPIASNVTVTVPLPPVILNGPATVKATVDDATTGGNTIASAEYSLNGGLWNAMTAEDGTFNQVSEEVEATFTATEVGENEVCVRGTDSLGNVGDPVCQTFLVTYEFEGFFSPIENGSYVNVAKAGQAVPAKWRLTDYNGVPIADPASFWGLYSYPVSCTDFQGNPADAVEEYAPGSSTLQYNGDGNWQFNWKTPKEYANSPNNCRALYVEFDSGATSEVAKFQFKK